MTPLYTEKSWFALKIFFGKGKPIKDYFVTNNIEHVYDVKKEFWDKTKKKRFVKDVPVMPSLILFRTTRVEAEHIERLFLNKVMLYRGKNSEDRREPSTLPHAAKYSTNSWHMICRKLHYEWSRLSCKHLCFL